MSLFSFFEYAMFFDLKISISRAAPDQVDYGFSVIRINGEARSGG